MQDGAWHLGGGSRTPGVDPAREGYPSGQGVGAIADPGACGRPGPPRSWTEAEGIASGMRRFAGR